MRYSIEGGQLPVVICTLENGESMITEKGAMAWMSPNMEMQTQGTGGLGKSLGRLFSGDSVFQNKYTAHGGQGQIAFASSFPGSIVAMDISQNPIIAQKSAFLASEAGVNLSVFFRKTFGTGLFGGEGFIMQKLEGNGIAFLEIDGSVVEYELAAGQQIVADTGYVAYMSATCRMDIVPVKGAKNILFGGEGLFNTVVTGPGKVGLQTMPASAVAGVLLPYLPVSSGN
ncbi:MAG: TIGR00266 family protein [Firmicutes bacterium]|nr:TIGR00266 family protein [Bacillota bacterium]